MHQVGWAQSPFWQPQAHQGSLGRLLRRGLRPPAGVTGAAASWCFVCGGVTAGRGQETDGTPGLHHRSCK